MAFRSLKKIILVLTLSFISVYAQKGPDSDEGIADGDTLLVPLEIPDSSHLRIPEKTIKDDILDLLYGAIFRDTSGYKNSMDDLTASEAHFRIHSGKRISKIHLTKIPVFGGTLEDSLAMEISDLEAFGNSLHTSTRDRVIRNNLLFTEGDTIQAFRLADNERILRRLPYIRDARIIVVEESDGDAVEVFVLTRDVFSIGVNFKVYAADDMAVSLFDRNLLGNGWEFRNTFRHRANQNPSWGYEGIFDIPNVMGSFINGTVSYTNAFDKEQGRISFSRSYLTQALRYAGGIELFHSSLRNELTDYSSILYTSNTYDLWFGRSFLIGPIENQNSIKLGLRYFQRDFQERPVVRPDTNFNYHRQKLYLGNIIFDQLKYLTSNMILGFGRTEDVSQGYALEATAGFGDGEFKERYYSGLQFWAAHWFDNIGYFAASLRVASYLYQKKAEDGLLGFQLIYFTPLMDAGDYYFRHFIYTDYLKGFNRANLQVIDIKDDNGIRGLSHDGLIGSEKLVFTIENRFFTPWNLFGFRLTLSSFVDLGYISDGHHLVDKGNFSSALGLGCQIRNEALVFQTLNLRFTYYPQVPDGVSNFGFKVTLSEPLLFSPLNLGKPRLFPYN